MSNMTTQNGFTAMKGHVAHGQQVTMAGGDVLTIQDSLTGWLIVNGDKLLANVGHSAIAVERFIVSYRD